MSHAANTAMGHTGPGSPQHTRFVNVLKKWMRLIHRYLALVFNVGFLLWFLSGFIMMYTDFPSLSLHDRLALRRPLSSLKIRRPPSRAHRHSGMKTSLFSVRVGMVVDRPVYWFQDLHGQVQTVYADTGERVVVDRMLARRIVNDCQEPAPSIHHLDQMAELDQWTPTPEYVPHMPLYRVHLNDEWRTVLYVSSATGEIVQKVTAREKLWAWLGPIPHWLYLRDLRVHNDLWRQVVLWSAALGVVMCLAGLIQGVVRYERKEGVLAFSPYQQRWFRWHHSTGFLFGVVVLTWILSGLLSMDPFRWSPSRALSDGETLRWQGGALDLQQFRVPPGRAVDILTTDGHGPVKELQLIQIQTRPYYLAYVAGDHTRLLAADATAPEPMTRLSEATLLRAIKRVNPSPLAEYRLLPDYDAYYYAKDRIKPLPVFRVKLDDAPSTWYYINPHTGAVVEKFQSLSRMNRWVYHGLHSWDFPQIFFKRPLWDLIVILLLTGGTSVSVTGVILFFRWMRRKAVPAGRVVRAPRKQG